MNLTAILHDKGISRLACLIDVKRGHLYLGFLCKNCGEKIYALEKTSDVPIIGDGLFSVPCHSCGVDKLIYKTTDFKPFKATHDMTRSKSLPRRKPSNRPRQPLGKRYPKAESTFGVRFLEERPECAVIIARCISIWAYIENELALLLASILKINTKPAIAIFLAIQNSRTQFDVLNAAAEAALDDKDFELFGATMNIKKTLEKERNDLVHGLYGGSDLVKEGILWVELKNMTSHTATVWASDYKDVGDKQMRKQTFIYEPEDLESIAQKFEWLYNFIGFFRGYISSDNTAWRAERYSQLCAESQVVEELIRMRMVKKNAEKNQKEKVK